MGLVRLAVWALGLGYLFGVVPAVLISHRMILDVIWARALLHNSVDSWFDFTEPYSIWCTTTGLARDLGEMHVLDVAAPRPLELVVELQFGLPCRSHAYVLTRCSGEAPRLFGRSGLQVGGGVLPAQVRLLALLLNSACIWLACLVARSVIRVAKARHRQRGGACWGCGYSRTGLDANLECPECGSLHKQ